MVKNRFTLDLRVPGRTEYLALVGSIAECVARRLQDYRGDRDALAFNLNIVVTEAVGNAIRHGISAHSRSRLRICIEVRADELVIEVHDHGQGFDLDTLPDVPPDDLDEGGRGLFVMRSLMDSLTYKRTKAGNVLEMRKRLR
ncbi:MAG: ATP-binding protein [Gammaproteobacteria bacterium]|nr:ATP-binding protein [Gammaproteobacteria bacterium]